MAKKNPKLFAFDDAIQSAVTVAKEQAASRVTEVNKTTVANLRKVIADAIKNETPPAEAADAIASLVGLTSAQSSALAKYREELEDSGLKADKIRAKVEEYADDLLTQRAESIARTEIMESLNDGMQESWYAAQEEGYLSPNATKEFIVTPDDALCPQCEPYDGKQVPLGSEFPEGDPPLHPRCRCTLAIGTP